MHPTHRDQLRFQFRLSTFVVTDSFSLMAIYRALGVTASRARYLLSHSLSRPYSQAESPLSSWALTSMSNSPPHMKGPYSSLFRHAPNPVSGLPSQSCNYFTDYPSHRTQPSLVLTIESSISGKGGVRQQKELWVEDSRGEWSSIGTYNY